MDAMVTNALQFLMICIFAFIPLLLGEVAGSRSLPTTEDFILYGRKMPLFPMYATVFSTWMSAFAFMGGISYFYTHGPLYMTAVGWDALFAVLFFVLGKRIWFYGKAHRYLTATDFFDDMYESRGLNVLTLVLTMISTLVYLQAQIVGGILVLNLVTGGLINSEIGGIIFFSIIIIYLWAGGLRAVAMADTFYGALVVIAALSSGFFLIHIAGGVEDVFSRLVELDPDNVSMNGSEGGRRTVLWLSLFVIVPTGAFMGPQIWIRNYAAGSARHFHVLPFLLVISSAICIGTLFAGSASIVLQPDASDTQSAFVQLMVQYANPYFLAFTIVGVFAAIFSTANSQIHALAAVFTMDIFRRCLNPKAPDRKLVIVAKWAVLGISILSFLLIPITSQSLFNLAILAFGSQAQLIIPVLGALFWKQSTAKAAILGLTAGEITFAVGTFCSIELAGLFGLCALVVNLLVFAVTALCDKSKITVSHRIEDYQKAYVRSNTEQRSSL